MSANTNTVTTQDSYAFEAWRGALSLNNFAVSLYSRGCFSQANSLLRESLSLIKMSCSYIHTTASINSNNRHQEEELSQRIQRARLQYVSLLHQMQHLPLLEHVKVLHSTGHPVEVPSASSTSGAAEVSFVHIEASSSSSSCDDSILSPSKELDVHAACILYNCGMAQMYESCLQEAQLGGSTLSLKTKNRALSLLKASHLVLTQAINEDASKGIIIPDLVVCIHITTLQTMVILLQDLGFQEDAADAAKCLCNMVEHFSLFMNDLLCFDSSAAPAA
jgi:hypothetical protein